MRIPKNIASMSDAEHYAWLQSLSSEEHSQAARKTYRLVEYVVSWVDADGDIIETEAFETLEEAEDHYMICGTCRDGDECKAAVLERLTNHYSVLDRNLEDREYKTLYTRGDSNALLYGGF